MRKKSNVISTIVLIIMLLVGLSVMLYPTISDWWNTREQRAAVARYNDVIAEMDDGETERLLNEAHEYNEKLAGVFAPFTNYDQISGYEDILNISGTGVIGYISIPFIKIELPIYHGTSEEVLNIAAGHLQGSSLPVGGNNTHAVISAHRGLPSAKLFTDLDQLVVGDTFTITVLGEVYTYEIEKILTVKPEEVDKLAIIPNGDYVTLMTCTPYGINTHRLLLRSHRIETTYHYDAKVVADAVQIDPILAVPAISAPLVILLICFWIAGSKKKERPSARRSFEMLMKKQTTD
ncbi:MAG: class C sortase [Ruminococcus sp.]|nr:class C sortase [Ruminococcus sp.]